jgi:hypothetical protein
MRITALAQNALAPAVRECWGFDCTYNHDDAPQWARWARLRPASRLVMRYITGSATEKRAKELAALGVPNVVVGPARTRDHGSVPQAHFRELLIATPSLQPRSP